MKIRLDIVDAEGTEYSYGEGDILARSASVDTKITSDEPRDVEMGDVSLLLGVDTLMGFTSILDVPAGAVYRARLVQVDTGETLLGGAVRSKDIQFDDQKRAWTVIIYERATGQVWEHLQGVWVDEIAWQSEQQYDALPPQLSKTALDMYYRLEGEGKTSKIQRYDGYPFYDLLSVVAMVCADVATSWTLPSEAVEHQVRLSGETVTIATTPKIAGTGFLGLPAWRADTFMADVLSYTGWWLRATYATWPDDDIEIELITSRFESGSPPVINGNAMASSWGMRVQERKDYALQIGDGAGRPSVNPHDEFELTDAAAADRLGAPPAAHATYASPEWNVEPACIDANGDMTDSRTALDDNVQQIEFKIPDIVVEGTTSEAIGSSTRTRAYGLPLHPEPQTPGPVPGRDRTNVAFPLADPAGNRLRRSGDPYHITGRCEPDKGVILVEILEVGGETKAEHHSVVSSPSASQHPVLSSSWAAQVLEQHTLLASDRHVLEGEYDLSPHSIRGVGTSEMVEAQGATWAITDHELDTVRGTSNIVAIRPIIGDLQSGVPSLPSDLSEWRVLRLTVDVYRWKDAGDDRDYIAVWWEPPPAAEAAALEYEGEFKDLTVSSPSWQDYFTTYSTSYIQPGIAGGPTPAEYNFVVRVRPVTHDGQTGQWVEVNAMKTF